MPPARREPELLGQTVVVIGGSAGIGLETARRARAEGADVVLTGRNPERLEQAASELGASSTAAFDATDPAALKRFFEDLPEPDRPRDGHRPAGPTLRAACSRWMLRPGAATRSTTTWCSALEVARNAAGKMRPGGTLILMGGTGGRRISRELGIVSAATAALPAADGQPRARARAGPGQPDRRRLRRHPVVGFAARRQTRGAPRRAAHDAADRARGRARPTSPRSPFTS